MTDIAISGHPHTDVVFGCFDCLFHDVKVGGWGKVVIAGCKHILAKFKHLTILINRIWVLRDRLSLVYEKYEQPTLYHLFDDDIR